MDGEFVELAIKMGAERKVAARMKAARQLRDELRRGLLEAVGQG